MVGIPGSGKSFFAEKFAETFHAPYFSHEKIATLVQDQEITGILMELIFKEVLKTKQSIILEGFADTRLDRADLEKFAKSAGYEALFIWVQTDYETAKSRSTKVSKNKLSRTLKPAEFDAIYDQFVPPHANEKPIVISGKHTYASQARMILKRLSSPLPKIDSEAIPSATTREVQTGRRNITIR